VAHPAQNIRKGRSNLHVRLCQSVSPPSALSGQRRAAHLKQIKERSNDFEDASTLLPVSKLMMKITAASSFFVQKTMKHGRERSSMLPMPPLYYLFPSSICEQGSIFEELCNRGVSVTVIENMYQNAKCTFTSSSMNPTPFFKSWEYAACDLHATHLQWQFSTTTAMLAMQTRSNGGGGGSNLCTLCGTRLDQ